MRETTMKDGGPTVNASPTKARTRAAPSPWPHKLACVERGGHPKIIIRLVRSDQHGDDFGGSRTKAKHTRSKK